MRLAFLALFGLAAAASAAEPAPAAWKDADTAERRVFETLKRRLERYPKAIPEKNPVADALATLNAPLVVEFPCGSVTVSTVLKAWKPQAEKGGWYEWGGVRGEDGDDEKGKRRTVFVNVLALDAAELEEYDARSLKFRVYNASLFYHELLHGQLLIDAMRSDKKWREAFCAKGAVDFDFGPADAQDPHKVIPAIQKAHEDALWEAVKDLKNPF